MERGPLFLGLGSGSFALGVSLEITSWAAACSITLADEDPRSGGKGGASGLELVTGGALAAGGGTGVGFASAAESRDATTVSVARAAGDTGMRAGVGPGLPVDGLDSGTRAAGAAGTLGFGLAVVLGAAGAGGWRTVMRVAGAAVGPGLGAGGMGAAGFVWTGAGALTLGGGVAATGLAGAAGLCFGGATTVGPGGGAALGAGARATGLGAATGAGFAFCGGGPNVIRCRSGRARTRGSETGGSACARAGEVVARLGSGMASCGPSNGRKPAMAGSGAAAGGGSTSGSTSPSRSSSPNPVVCNKQAMDSSQRIDG